MYVLEHPEWLNRRRALLPHHIEPESLTRAHMPPADVHRNGGAILAYDQRGAQVLDAAGGTAEHVGGDPLRQRPSGEPESEVDQGHAEVEDRPPSRFRAVEPPSELLPGGLEGVPAAADGVDGSELAPIHEV